MAAAPPSSPQPRTEHRFPVFVAAVIALVLFAVLPSEVQFLPNWLVPSIAGVVLIPLIAINPRRLNNETRWSRWIGIGFAPFDLRRQRTDTVNRSRESIRRAQPHDRRGIGQDRRRRDEC